MLVPATPRCAISANAVSKMCWRCPPGTEPASATAPLLGLVAVASNRPVGSLSLPAAPAGTERETLRRRSGSAALARPIPVGTDPRGVSDGTCTPDLQGHNLAL